MVIEVIVAVPGFGEICRGELVQELEDGYTIIKNSEGKEIKYKSFQVFKDNTKLIEAGKQWLSVNYHLRHTAQYKKAELLLQELQEGVI